MKRAKSFHYSLTGPKKLKTQLEALVKASDPRMARAVQEATFLIHSTARKLIQDNSSGTPAVRYTDGRKRNVKVSKPGDPPNTDTGRLVQSVNFNFTDKGLTGQVGTNLRYGAYLEFGTSDMAPRPWLSAAARMSEAKIKKIFREHFSELVKESTR